MEQNFRVRKRNPESARPMRPDFRIVAQKKKDRQSKKSERPMARPGNAAGLRAERDFSCVQIPRRSSAFRYAGIHAFEKSVRVNGPMLVQLGLHSQDRTIDDECRRWLRQM
jgi:hypothetical protein